MPKNIVIFSDGTAKDGGKGPNTNVYKLFNMIEDRTDNQISFYDRGLGTGARGISGKLMGRGISKNIKECYAFIFEHYKAGDQIYLFGFSRGATTVRSLSNFIHLFGILPKSRPELIDEAYEIYKKRKTRDKKSTEFINRHHNQWTKIHFVGIWDTVAALGIPIKGLNVLAEQIPGVRHKYQNFGMSESIVHGRHALAIDDERETFHPVPWEVETKSYQTLEQVWFCGMHSDVGGGYADHELSDVPLIWMIDEGVNKGLRMYSYDKARLSPNSDGNMHDSRGGKLGRLWRRKKRSWDTTNRGKPVVHPSVMKRTKNRKNEPIGYKPWILETDFEVWSE